MCIYPHKTHWVDCINLLTGTARFIKWHSDQTDTTASLNAHLFCTTRYTCWPEILIEGGGWVVFISHCIENKTNFKCKILLICSFVSLDIHLYHIIWHLKYTLHNYPVLLWLRNASLLQCSFCSRCLKTSTWQGYFSHMWITCTMTKNIYTSQIETENTDMTGRGARIPCPLWVSRSCTYIIRRSENDQCEVNVTCILYSIDDECHSAASGQVGSKLKGKATV